MGRITLTNPRHKRVILGIIALVVGALTLLCVELATRIVMPYRNPLRIFVKSVVAEDMQRSMAPVVEFDPELSYRIRPGVRKGHLAATEFNSNSDGLRRDDEIGRKPAGGIRILCVGDSCTFGFGIPAYWSDGAHPVDTSQKPYAAQLEELLRASFPGRSIEVLNLGVPGYASAQGVITTGRNLPKYDGDIVTAMFFNNDIVDPGATARASKPRGFQIPLRHLAKRSQFVTHLVDWTNRQSTPRKLEGFGLPNTSVEDYVTHFDQMRALCAKRGAEFVVINPFSQMLPENDPWLPPYRIPEFRNALKAYVRAAGLPFLDIPELTEDYYPANNPLFIERVHPNYDGHKMIAQRLHDLLRPIVEKRLAAAK